MLDAVLRYVSMFATVPVSVRVPVDEPLTVTLPPDDAASVPALAAIVTVILLDPASTSERVIADKSTFPAVSSVTVIDAGTPVAVGSSLTAVMFTATVPNVTLPPPPVPVLPPSLAVIVKVAALFPDVFVVPVYWMLDAVFRKVSIFATVPVKVSVPVAEPPMVTPPPDEAVRVPLSAAIVTVMLLDAASTSEIVIAERSTLLAVSSVTVIDAGTPDAVGSSLTAVILTVIELDEESTVPSLTFAEMVAALFPFAFDAP